MSAKRVEDHLKQRLIGLYGGSFDPIHFGHINLALELMERHHLDEVWFIPAPLSPHKVGREPAPFLDRKRMIELAIQDIPQFRMKDLEGHRPPPSYTVDTLKEIIAATRHHLHPIQFYLLLGEDIIPDFFHWRSPDEIVSLVPLLIGSRTGKWIPAPEDKKIQPSVISSIRAGMTHIRMMDISSTDIRERLAKGLYCGHLVPSKVLDYITLTSNE
jgi:nicotinate-nucleotide adenylyltransferase